jgi:hypothetical protein
LIAHGRKYRSGYRLGNLALHSKNMLNLPIVAFRPNAGTCQNVDKLHRYSRL